MIKQFFLKRQNKLFKNNIHHSLMEKQLDFYSKKEIIKPRHFCGNEFKINEKVKLFGWVENIRKM